MKDYKKEYAILKKKESQAKKALKEVKANLKKNGEHEYKCHLTNEYKIWREASDKRIALLIEARSNGIELLNR